MLLRPALLLGLTLSVHAAQVKLGEQTFTIPDGFEIEVAASPPLVDRPITMAFDESGALFVSDSSGSNDPVKKQLAEKPHRILRLVDRDSDGRFDERTIFADQMMFPEGTMWLDGSLYVSAPPQIWRLTDTNHDGVADERKVWFDGKTLTNCGNDLHGPYAGPDGWIYWCKGAFDEQIHQLGNGQQFTTRACHIFRARPDGTGLEAVMTGGMDNPVDVVFTPSGERLLSGTFFINPGGGKRDGILHAVHGGVWGKDHAVLEGHPRTGELMPIMAHLGPAAPSGLEMLRSPSWGAAWQGNAFACQFNLHKVSRHVLTHHGATFKSVDTDFVVSDQADFHPTDTVEDADGSLLIADTGGWYKLCCPTSQLHKPDVLGTIYRVRKHGVAKVEDPRGSNLDWKTGDGNSLAERLADTRPAVVERAMNALGRIGDAAVTPLAQWLHTTRPGVSTQPTSARRNAIWTLARIPGDSARAANRFAFADRDSSVRTAASHAAGLWRDPGAVEALINQLTHSDFHLRRAAAEALGKIGVSTSASALIAAAPATPDRFLEHSLAFALIELKGTEAARFGLKQAKPAAIRIGLASLNQLGELRADEFLPYLDSRDSETRVLSEWLAAQHPEWGDAFAGWLKSQPDGDAPEDVRKRVELLGRLASNGKVQALIAEWASHADDDPAEPNRKMRPRRTMAFEAMRLSQLKHIPDSWIAPIETALRNPGPAVLDALSVVSTFVSVKDFPPSFRDALETISKNPSAPVPERVAALAALPGNPGKLTHELFELLIMETRQTDVLRMRSAAAQIARAQLDSEQLSAVADLLPTAGPAVLPGLLEVFRTRRDEASSAKLLAQLAKVQALPAPIIRSILSDHPPKVRDAAETILAAGSGLQSRVRLDQLAQELPKGDVRRGHQLFQSARSACSTCHAMAYVGGNLGPDLTKIGSIRTERDLLEAIVFPSASFVRSYEPVMVKTKTKGEYFGIVRRDNEGGLRLATGPGVESDITREEVVSLEPAPVSLMPQGYDGIFTPQEIADLVAFLKAAK